MEWHCRHFSQIDTSSLFRILQLRAAVFVVEQNCPYPDPDDKDPQCFHLWATGEDGRVIACCRLLPPGCSYAECSIGRVATHASVRGTGAGRALMAQALENVQRLWPGGAVRISAQSYLQGFYESMGFVREGEEYLEDNIPHIEMLRPGYIS